MLRNVPWRARATTYWRRDSCSASCPRALPWAHVDLSSATRRGGLAQVPTEITGFGARFRNLPAAGRKTAEMSDSLRIRQPDDWHLHLRDSAALSAVLPHTAAQFARAIVMPNLRVPVTTTALGARLFRADHCRAPGGQHLSAFDDAVPD